MSDEAAFLAALKANPADDTTRLVYADWLDEHGEAAKAEYLRLISRLPVVGDDIDVRTTEATRATELGAALSAEWKEVAAGRFDLVLLDFSDKIQGIKRVREVFDVGLASAKGIVECAPNRLVTHTPFDSALSYLTRLSDNTGMALVIRPCGRNGAPHAVLLQVVADCIPYESANYDPEQWGLDPERDEQALSALARLVAEALGIAQDDARAQIQATSFIPADRYSAINFVLADDVSLPEAKQIVARCRPFVTINNRFGVDCHITGRVSRNL